MGRIVGIGVGNGAERGERLLHRGKPCRVATLDRAPQRQSLDIDAGLRSRREVGGETGLTRKPRWSDACTSPSATSRDSASRTAARLTEKLFGEAGDMQLLAG
jgi:hypothetical protein